jgi:hypothetical protein
MTTPDAPAAAPLDAERVRLRTAGYTDAEISHILTQREIGASLQPAGAAGQGVMSNVLSSIVAVASHTRLLIPTFRKDVETVFDGTATASMRAGATASLAVKAIVVIVLGFAAWQEWKQHIIYSTEIAESQARKLKAEADAASGRVIPLCEIDHSCPKAAPLSADDRAVRADCLALKGKREAPGAHDPLLPGVQQNCASVGVDLAGGTPQESDPTRYDAVTGRCEWSEHLSDQEQRLKDAGIEAHCPQEQIDAGNAAFLKRFRKDPVKQ